MLVVSRPLASVTPSASGTHAPSRLRSTTTCPPTTGSPSAVTVTVTVVGSPANTAGAATVTTAGSTAAARAGPARTAMAVVPATKPIINLLIMVSDGAIPADRGEACRAHENLF
jgi:hypothetical protein